MRVFKKLLAIVAAFALAAALPLLLPAPMPVDAQDVSNSISRILSGDTVSGGIAADDGDVVLLVKYIGTAGSGTVEVADATGDLTFKDGVIGSEAAVDDFECPVSGALGGIIDTSNSACDTLGEVVDTINGNCTGCNTSAWRAVILDGLRADSADNTLQTQAATSAQVANGVPLYRETDTAFLAARAMTTMRTIQPYIDNRDSKLIPDPFIGTRAVAFLAKGTSTFGSGTSTLEVWSVKVTHGTAGAETTTQLWSQAGGATTAEKVFDTFNDYGLHSKKGEKLLVRLKNSAAASSVVFFVGGMQYRYN